MTPPSEQPVASPDNEPRLLRALVVGASGGLGAAFVRCLEVDPAVGHIVAWSRNGCSTRGGKISAACVDFLDEATIERAAHALGEIDLAIVATGLLHDSSLRPEKTWRSLDAAAMLRSYEVNTIGPALVAKHVLPHLSRDRRAIFAVLSARVGSISDNRLGGWHSYRASKAALNQVIRCLAIELAPRRPLAICVGLHPGTVDTGLSKPFQAGVAGDSLFSPDHSAGRLIEVLGRLTPAQSGRLFDWAGVEIAP